MLFRVRSTFVTTIGGTQQAPSSIPPRASYPFALACITWCRLLAGDLRYGRRKAVSSLRLGDPQPYGLTRLKAIGIRPPGLRLPRSEKAVQRVRVPQQCLCLHDHIPERFLEAVAAPRCRQCRYEPCLAQSL